LANPGAVVVTRDGDRFGTTGWRVGGTTAGLGTEAGRAALAKLKD